MKIWLITDTHFGHDKMIPYCGRPEGFEEVILQNLSVLNDHDVLVHLGDICIGKDAYWHEELMHRVNGRKWLLRGNHDGKSDSWYLSHGWDFVGEQFLIERYGRKILFSHVPQKDTGYFDVNIHGHFHNSLHRLLEGKYVIDGEKERNKEDLAVLTEKHKLLAIEYTEYKPVLLDTFIQEL